MAEDDLETEYHLTPNGWTIGTRRFFGEAKQTISPPPDRVLTIIEHIYQRSIHSPEQTSQREAWRSKDVSDIDLANLKQRFPLPT